MEVINIKVNGQFLSADSKNACPAGSANTALLRFVFDESWMGYAKRVLWRDAKGENPASVILAPEIGTGNVYTSQVPSEVMKMAGWCSYSIEGYYESNPEKVMKSITDRLFVAYSNKSDDISAPTPSEVMQLQAEFEGLMPAVEELLADSTEEIEKISENLSRWEMYSRDSIYEKGNKVAYNGRCYVCIEKNCNIPPDNESCWMMIADRGEKGDTGNQGPQGIQGEKGERGEKGEKGDTGARGAVGEKGDTGERGMNGITVPVNGFYTFNVDDEGNLWINSPDSQNVPEIRLNENGELILSTDGENGAFFNVGRVKGDTGEKGEKGEAGYTPVKGADYYTETEKQELIQEIKTEVTGDVETALDNIIDIQNLLIGGDSV